MLLIELKRELPCPSIYGRALALDMAETVSEDASVCKEHWQLTGTMKIYGNESLVAMEVSEKDESHSVLHLKMLSPAPRLSINGQSRALGFLADAIEQLLENSLSNK